MTGSAYVDASAVVKLLVDESDSLAMYRWFVETERLVTSRVGVIETVRAVSRKPHDAVRRERIVSELGVIELTPAVALLARTIGPTTLRTLDAIHLASAALIGPRLDAFVTYDDRLATAARALGLPVVRPA